MRYIVLMIFLFLSSSFADSFDDTPNYAEVLKEIKAYQKKYKKHTYKQSKELVAKGSFEIEEIETDINENSHTSIKYFKANNLHNSNVKVIKYIGNNNQNNSESIEKVDLDFWQLLKEALKSSAKIVLKKHDIKYAQANVDIVKNEYYPKLSLNYDHEYYHGFSRTNSANIGGSTYPATSDYRNSLYLSLNHELYRFGATDLKTELAESDIAIVKSELELEMENVSKELLNNFVDALKAQESIRYKEQILKLQNSLLYDSQRLYDVGKIAKTDVTQRKIFIANIEKDIAQKKVQKLEALKNIEILTNIKIDTNIVELKYLEPKNIRHILFDESIKAQNIKLQIEKKLKEIELLKKDRYPTLYVNGEYRLYGSDNESLSAAIRDLERNNWRVGLTAKWTIFDGFKTDKTIKQAKIEVEKLIEQYRFQKADFESKERKRELLKKSIENILREEDKLISQYSEQKEMLSRLEAIGKVSSMKLKEIEIERLKIEMDFKLQVIEKVYEEIMSELIY